MITEVVMAGFGGQGLMLIGKILAQAGMDEGYHVSWLPSYGPEMRGGTANCTVVVADRAIGSPVVNSPSGAVVMNRPSLEKFGADVKPGGVVVINTSLIPIGTNRDDVREVNVPANEIAIKLGAPRSANMVALGAYIAAIGLIKKESVEKYIEYNFKEKPDIIEVNLQAFRKGCDWVEKGGST